MKWLKRKSVLTVTGMATASVAMFRHVMPPETWVYAMAVFLAGHHAEDLIKAVKGQQPAADEAPAPAETRSWEADHAGSAKSDHG